MSSAGLCCALKIYRIPNNTNNSKRTAKQSLKNRDVYYDLVGRLRLPVTHKIGAMSCGQRSQMVLDPQ